MGTSYKNGVKALCCLSGTPDATVSLFNRGYDVLCYSGDVWLYQNALMTGISEIRTKCT